VIINNNTDCDMKKTAKKKVVKKSVNQQKGGLTTLKTYGKEHYSKIALKRWKKVRAEKKKLKASEVF
jgi:hypothetical protein